MSRPEAEQKKWNDALKKLADHERDHQNDTRTRLEEYHGTLTGMKVSGQGSTESAAFITAIGSLEAKASGARDAFNRNEKRDSDRRHGAGEGRIIVK